MMVNNTKKLLAINEIRFANKQLKTLVQELLVANRDLKKNGFDYNNDRGQFQLSLDINQKAFEITQYIDNNEKLIERAILAFK